MILFCSNIQTPLGGLVAIYDKKALYLLQFEDHLKEEEIAQLKKFTGCSSLLKEKSSLLDLIEEELELYFQGTLKEFKTPLHLFGTPFQKKVWQELQKIPYGKLISYAELANFIEHPQAHRAAGNANGANRIPIFIPCHRVIQANGRLGGFSSGLKRKEWLIDHEQATLQKSSPKKKG